VQPQEGTGFMVAPPGPPPRPPAPPADRTNPTAKHRTPRPRTASSFPAAWAPTLEEGTSLALLVSMVQGEFTAIQQDPQDPGVPTTRVAPFGQVIGQQPDFLRRGPA